MMADFNECLRCVCERIIPYHDGIKFLQVSGRAAVQILRTTAADCIVDRLAVVHSNDGLVGGYRASCHCVRALCISVQQVHAIAKTCMLSKVASVPVGGGRGLSPKTERGIHV